MKYIYEHDMPDNCPIGLDNNHDICSAGTCNKCMYEKGRVNKNRFKPNGITDGIKRWKLKKKIRSIINGDD